MFRMRRPRLLAHIGALPTHDGPGEIGTLEQHDVALRSRFHDYRRRTIGMAAAVLMAIIATALGCVNRFHHTPPTTALDDNKLTRDGELLIERWTLVGPIALVKGKNPSVDDGFGLDYLATLGGSERAATYDSIKTVCEHHAGLCRPYSGDGAVIPLFRYFPANPHSVAYAAVNLVCNRDMNVVLEAGSSEGIYAYVNGTPVVSVPIGDKGDTATKYHHLALVTLHSGTNLLVIKSDTEDLSNTWAVIASIMSTRAGTIKSIDSSDNYIVRQRLLRSGDPLIVSNPDLTGHMEGCVSIADWKSQVVRTEQCTRSRQIDIDTRRLADGYYTITMTVGGTSIHDEVFIGNLRIIRDILEGAGSKRGISDHAYRERDALLQRFKILQNPQYSHPEVADWQRKMLLVIRNAIMAERYRENDRWLLLPGMHLNSYKSDIDGSLQYYLIYIPNGGSDRLPLVVDMPYAQNPERPFLESALAIGWPQALDDIKRAADRHKFAVAVIDGRGNVGDSPIGEADTIEAIRSIYNDYRVDLRRLFVFGVCEGGRRALRMVNHYPGLFAAAGVYGPALDSDQRAATNGPEGFGGLATTPVEIVQGEFDDVPARDVLLRYFSGLHKINQLSKLEILPDGTHGTNASEEILYPWFSQHRNAMVPSIDSAARTSVAAGQ